MIKNQKKFIEYLKSTSDILSSISIIDKSKIDTYIEQIKNTELIVPVVGGFSAGKSTLINQFLDNKILSTSVTPETALATELRYNQNEYVEAIKKDDTIDRYEISELEN